jgi:uncharacterized protein (TIGR03437 family)
MNTDKTRAFFFLIGVHQRLSAAGILGRRFAWQSSAAQPVDIAAAAPGIFTQDGSGTGAGLIVPPSDYSSVTADNPAHAGDYLVIFCTGLGATQVLVPSGSAATGPDLVTANVTLQIEGAEKSFTPDFRLATRAYTRSIFSSRKSRRDPFSLA